MKTYKGGIKMDYVYIGGITNDSGLHVGNKYRINYNYWGRPVIMFQNGCGIINKWTLEKCFRVATNE